MCYNSEDITGEKENMSKWKKWKTAFWMVPVLAGCLAVFLEFFVFNIRHWESYLWRTEHTLLEERLMGEGLEPLGDNLYRITAEEGEETASIEILNINQKLYNLHIRMTVENPASAEEDVVLVQVKINDEANEKYFRLTERAIVRGVEKSEYMRVHLSGTTTEAMILIHGTKGQVIRIEDISGNVPVPFSFSAGRLAAVFGLLLAAYLLRPMSGIHKKKYVDCGWKGYALVAVILCLEFAAAAVVQNQNLPAVSRDREEQETRQYQMLAHSLAEGHPWLDVEPEEWLKSMPDPYDYRARSMQMETEGGSYLWDTAYYEGKYYVYFGIVPELVFFLPYYLVTGQDLSTLPVVWFTGCLFMVGVFILLGEIIKKWYRGTPFSVYLLLGLLIANGSGVWMFFRNPVFYDVPILLGLAFAVWGLAFWLKALSGERCNRVQMGLGSFLIALVAGCRPQLVLVSALAIPLFGRAIREKKVLQEKRLPDLAAFFLPVVLVAAGLMYYNQIRFGSVTDFGAAYNLTIQNMTKREFKLGRIIPGYFTMLFQPPVITGLFPYFEQVDVKSQFYGQAIVESGFGGIMALNLILWISLIPRQFKKYIGQKDAYCWAWLLLLLGLLLACVDLQIGGLIPRYTVDFTWLFFLAAVPAICGIAQSTAGTAAWNRVYGAFLLLFAQSMVYHFFTIFTDVYEKMQQMNPRWFYGAEHLLEFLL